MKYLFILLATFSASCNIKSPKETVSNKTLALLKVWATENLKERDSTLTIDSLKIQYIDSITQKEDFAIMLQGKINQLTYANQIAEAQLKILKLEKDKYSNYQAIAQISGSSSGLSIFKQSFDEEKDKTDKAISEAQNLGHECDSLLKIANSNTLDSINPIYYQAVFTICYTDKKMEQTCKDSLVMNFTKDFRVKK